MQQVIILNTDQRPLEERHVAFFSVSGDREITICEVVEVFYPHPDAPDYMKISRLETRRGKTENVSSERSAAIRLVDLASSNMRDARDRFFVKNV